MTHSVSVSFFFFQAEDGIRDYKVTGVQTCALPISATDLQQGAPGCDHEGAFGDRGRRRRGLRKPTMATPEGQITQIIGAVIDVEFPRESIPRIYEALKLKDVDLTPEGQQQLGDGVVRTIAIGSSVCLKRFLAVQ